MLRTIKLSPEGLHKNPHATNNFLLRGLSWVVQRFSGALESILAPVMVHMFACDTVFRVDCVRLETPMRAPAIPTFTQKHLITPEGLKALLFWEPFIRVLVLVSQNYGHHFACPYNKD